VLCRGLYNHRNGTVKVELGNKAPTQSQSASCRVFYTFSASDTVLTFVLAEFITAATDASLLVAHHPICWNCVSDDSAFPPLPHPSLIETVADRRREQHIRELARQELQHDAREGYIHSEMCNIYGELRRMKREILTLRTRCGDTREEAPAPPPPSKRQRIQRGL